MSAWVLTPSTLIGGCPCFLGNLVRPSSFSKWSVPIILFRAEALEILEEFFYQKLERIKQRVDITTICTSVIVRQFADLVTVLKPSVFCHFSPV